MGKPRSWADIGPGKYQIPGEATHFRWCHASLVRSKPMDGGREYELADPSDRPDTAPPPRVKILPLIVEDGEEGKPKVVKDCPVKVGASGKIVKELIVEFEQDDDRRNDSDLLRTLMESVRMNNAPSQQLIDQYQDLRRENATLGQLVQEQQGGWFAQFVNNNPEVVKEGMSLAFSLGRKIGEIVECRLVIERENRRRLETGGVDVTPKN